MVKNPPAMWETRVQSLGWEDPLEKEMATHSSNLAWEIPWTEEPGGPQSMGLKELDLTERLTHLILHKLLSIVPCAITCMCRASQVAQDPVCVCVYIHICILLSRFSRVRLCATP